jgi:hypothetical protein
VTPRETQILTAAAARQDGTGVEAKIAALTAFLVRVLTTHSADYGLDGRVATHLSDAVVQASGRGDRVAIMGDPARYAEIDWLGRAEGGARLLDGSGYAGPQRFRVFVYYGRGDEAEDEAARSFRALCESTDPAQPGLLHAVEAVGFLVTPEGDEVTMSPASSVRTALVFASGSRPEDARHELAFDLTVS